MKMLGVIDWTTRDKLGSPIAGVRPLVELSQPDWRPINALEEFPPQGQVFWPGAQFAAEKALVTFSAADNPGQKHGFRVVDPQPVYEVFDLRSIGTAEEIRAALLRGVRMPGAAGTLKVQIWDKQDVLIGPVELTRIASGIVKLHEVNLARVPTFENAASQLRSVVVDGATRWLRVSDAAPSGFIDWDDDTAILRRALDTAVKIAKQAGHDTSLTKKQIENAAKALADHGLGADAQLARYRIERALALLANTETIAKGANELASILSDHPAIKTSLDAISTKVRAEVELSARADLKERLVREHSALDAARKEVAFANSEIAAKKVELSKVEAELVAVRNEILRASQEVESAVDARVRSAMDRPHELLAEVSVLRPLLGAGSYSHAPTNQRRSALDWSNTRGENVADKTAFRRSLTAAARARGVDPSLLFRVHAAIVARLMPVTLGPSALAALIAYSHGACGGRLMIVHVSPSAIGPQAFDEIGDVGLVSAAAAAASLDGISMVVLEGANRAPLEASVVPLLQLSESGLSRLTNVNGLRLAASFVTGATTVPVTPQLWSHAVAIYPEPNSPSTQASAPGDISLSSELLVPGDEPTDLIDELLDMWPESRELRPSISRFGSALTRLYEDESRIAESILHGLILPFVATGLSVEEQAEALSKAKDTDGSIAHSLRRLQRRLT